MGFWFIVGIDSIIFLCCNTVKVSREDYDHWRYRYPRAEAERNEAELKAMKEVHKAINTKELSDSNTNQIALIFLNRNFITVADDREMLPLLL